MLFHVRCFLVFWLAAALGAMAQPRLNNVRFELNANAKVVEIKYDVFGIGLEDSVYVVVTGKNTGKIVPRAISGAIGRKIKPGSDKKIYWDVVADNLKIDEEIEIQVHLSLANALLIAQPDTTKRMPKIVVENKVRRGLNGRALLLLGGGLVAGGGLYYWSTAIKAKSLESYELYKIRNWNHKDDLLLLGNDPFLKARAEVSLAQANADYNKAKRQQTLGQLLFIGGIVVVVVDAIFTIPSLIERKNNSVELHTETSAWGVNSLGIKLKF